MEQPRPARAGREADEPAGSPRPSAAAWAWEWVKSIATALLLFLLVRAFLVEAFKIPTGSMESTLLAGDFLLVNKLAYGAELPLAGRRLGRGNGPERREVVVFFPPHDSTKTYVKRVVGVPGDTLEMRDKVLYLNGAPQDEPYARTIDPVTDPADARMRWQTHHLATPARNPSGYAPTRDNWGPLVVPGDRFFALGDNRDNSEDSRHWGFVRRDALRGRPLLVYYSFERSLDHPFSWITSVRWGRIGERIR